MTALVYPAFHRMHSPETDLGEEFGIHPFEEAELGSWLVHWILTPHIGLIGRRRRGADPEQGGCCLSRERPLLSSSTERAESMVVLTRECLQGSGETKSSRAHRIHHTMSVSCFPYLGLVLDYLPSPCRRWDLDYACTCPQLLLIFLQYQCQLAIHPILLSWDLLLPPRSPTPDTHQCVHRIIPNYHWQKFSQLNCHQIPVTDHASPSTSDGVLSAWQV